MRTRASKNKLLAKRGVTKKLAEQSALLQAWEAAVSAEQKKAVVAKICAAIRFGSKDTSPLMACVKSDEGVVRVLESWIQDFVTESSIPAGIPFWTIFSLMANYLTDRGCVVRTPTGKSVVPILYTLVLADSGESKSWTMNQVSSCFPSQNLLTIPKSAEGLLTEAATMDGKATLLLDDELGRDWQRWMSDPAQSMIRDFLISAYLQTPFKRKLKKECYTVNKPVVSVLGYTQIDNFNTHFSPEDWVSGLLPRFTLCVCPQNSNWTNITLQHSPLETRLEKKSIPLLKSVLETPIHTDYVMDEQALAMADWSILDIAKKTGINKAFAQRGLYNMYKFALIFHYLAGKSNNVIDRFDMQLAVRLSTVSLGDVKYLMTESERSSISVLVEKAVGIKRDIDADKRKGPWCPRRLLQLVHGFTNVREAELVMQVVDTDSCDDTMCEADLHSDSKEPNWSRVKTGKCIKREDTVAEIVLEPTVSAPIETPVVASEDVPAIEEAVVTPEPITELCEIPTESLVQSEDLVTPEESIQTLDMSDTTGPVAEIALEPTVSAPVETPVVAQTSVERVGRLAEEMARQNAGKSFTIHQLLELATGLGD